MSYLANINWPQDLKALTKEELPTLAEELRSEIIRVCSIGGGHLASSLGAVELTVALHYLFDSSKDRFVWDVGHQTYGHKILTGRKDRIESIRKPGGLAGFTTSSESEHDALTVGHASTSIAAALGMVLARDARRESYEVIPIIGDGSLTGGMALAALNQVGQVKPRMTLILNDNEMSISENVGGLKNYLRSMQVQPWFQRAEKSGKQALSNFKMISELGSRAKHAARHFLDPVSLNPFHAMGVRYVGPIDGHDLEQLLYYLDHIRQLEGPTLLHIITKKGKGYEIAEADPIVWHGASKFNPQAPVAPSKGYSWSDAFGEAATSLADKDDRVWVITPAMRIGSGLDDYSKAHPDRYIDVGIAEDVAVTVGAGLALQGEKPIVAIYSTFLQRGFDQVIHDVCLENLDVVFAVDRAGLVGGDGATHQGIFDLSYLRALPNMSIAMPKDADEMQSMLKTALEMGGPKAIRWPRGSVKQAASLELSDWPTLDWGSWETLKEGKEVYILAFGATLNYALEVAKTEADVGVINARFVKPLDEKMLLDLDSSAKTLITVEDHTIMGGLGSAVAEFIADHQLNLNLKRLGIQDVVVPHGDPASQHEDLGYGPEAIRKVLAELGYSSARVFAQASD
ncbi:MAG: 1-deoxy-D-xylulose-5-phosphate synthase [Trueperaceae bacterium]|nr:1-deoxy-D-xylulose-5-phosphate synthase [Trueperaceae bacterium]